MTVAKKPTRSAPILTLAEAAAELGFDDARKLKRYLIRKERTLGVAIMERHGTGSRLRYSVPLASLRKHCPQLFRERGEGDTSDTLDAFIGSLRQWKKDTKARFTTLSRAIKALQERVASIEALTERPPATASDRKSGKVEGR